MNYRIAVIKGDGIGPEIVDEAVRVLKRAATAYGMDMTFTEVKAGGAAIDEYGTCLPEHTLDVCRNSDAVLLGAVGGPKWDSLAGPKRPERALLSLRKELGLYANIRPAIMFEALRDACPLRPDIAGSSLDIIIIRELTGGIYFGQREAGDDYAYDKMEYHKYEIERIARRAFETAARRSKRLVSVDKANVLESSRLWRRTVVEVGLDYPDVALSHMYVDNAAMQLVINPGQFDVIVTENMFGDILSDEASMITGSIGMLPSASLSDGSLGMYEPIHGSAPDIAGQNKANPTAAIMSAAMMLRYSLGRPDAAEAVETAVRSALDSGCRTGDIARGSESVMTTREMGEAIASFIK